MAGAPRNDLKPWLEPPWVIPPKASGGFAAAMGDVIEVYHRPADPGRPVVCAGEGGKPLVGEVREPPPVRPGSPAKEDPEYEGHGTADLFLAFEPRGGRRVVEVTERRTAIDSARFLEHLPDVASPSAAEPVPVTDTPNTHGTGSWYEAFDPAEARRPADRIEWHDTPEHGSRPNMAEVASSVLARQCLDGRIPDRETLTREVAAREAAGNAAGGRADWPFTTADARVELKRLYPSVEVQ